jgi:hypothetical protein
MAVMPAFIELLKRGRIDRPNSDVLARIRASYAYEAVVSIDDMDAALELYERVRTLPSTFTKKLVAAQGGLLVNGPLSHDTPKILTGSRLDGRPILVKLLILGFDDTRQVNVRTAELNCEADCCEKLAAADQDHSYALVPYEVVAMDVTADMVSQTRQSGAVKALVMPRYLGSIARAPSCPVIVVVREGRRIIDALRFMHRQGYVHMDVKGDNVFFDSDGVWFLGDFGSACEIDSAVLSTTEGFYHSPILRQPARPKYDWFMLLVMLLIELGDNKDEWAKKFVEDGNRNVSEARVHAEAQRIIANTTYGRDLIVIVEEIMGAYTSDEV